MRRTMSVSMNQARRDITWIPLSCSVTRSVLKLRTADMVAAYAAFQSRAYQVRPNSTLTDAPPPLWEMMCAKALGGSDDVVEVGVEHPSGRQDEVGI
jgi:hypothetical protein